MALLAGQRLRAPAPGRAGGGHRSGNGSNGSSNHNGTHRERGILPGTPDGAGCFRCTDAAWDHGNRGTCRSGLARRQPGPCAGPRPGAATPAAEPAPRAAGVAQPAGPDDRVQGPRLVAHAPGPWFALHRAGCRLGAAMAEVQCRPPVGLPSRAAPRRRGRCAAVRSARALAGASAGATAGRGLRGGVTQLERRRRHRLGGGPAAGPVLPAAGAQRVTGRSAATVLPAHRRSGRGHATGAAGRRPLLVDEDWLRRRLCARQPGAAADAAHHRPCRVAGPGVV